MKPGRKKIDKKDKFIRRSITLPPDVDFILKNVSNVSGYIGALVSAVNSDILEIESYTKKHNELTPSDSFYLYTEAKRGNLFAAKLLDGWEGVRSAK